MSLKIPNVILSYHTPFFINGPKVEAGRHPSLSIHAKFTFGLNPRYEAPIRQGQIPWAAEPAALKVHWGQAYLERPLGQAPMEVAALTVQRKIWRWVFSNQYEELIF